MKDLFKFMGISLFIFLLMVGCATLLGSREKFVSITVSSMEVPKAPPIEGLKLKVSFAEEPIRIDADLSDWPEVEPIVLNEEVQAKIEDWGGPEDVSANIYFAFDYENLYIGCEVRDDIFFQEELRSRIWEGDSIQVAFDTLKDRLSMGYAGDDYEYGLSLTKDGPISWCWNAPRGKIIGRVDNLTVAIKEKPKGMIYEVKIPFSELEPFSPFLMESCGMSIMVNDNDGEGRRGFIEWTPGIGGSKDPSSFGTLIVGGIEPPKERPLVGIMKKEKVFADEDEDFIIHLKLKSRYDGEAILEAKILDEEKLIASSREPLMLSSGVSGQELRFRTRGTDSGRYTLRVSVLTPDGEQMLVNEFKVYKYLSRW